MGHVDHPGEEIGPDHVRKKHLGGVKLEDITLGVGAGMSGGSRDGDAQEWTP